MKTRITELFGIRYPIICGGMFWVAEPELCAAISNAGGLGNITALRYESGDDLRRAIVRARELTDKPFGVNITLMPSWRIPKERFDDLFKVCAEEKVAVIEVAGAPAEKYINMLHKAGVKIMHKVGAVRHALKIEQLGYDAVIAAGIEEGGHPLDDDVASMVLTPRIAESVNIPVITAGGVSDGRGLAAAMSLGAEGVLMASRFIATEECTVHPAIKEELIKRQEYETRLICKSLKLQGRGLRNKLVDQILEVEAHGGGIEELVPLITGLRLPTACETGDVDSAVLYVGQSIGLIKKVSTCKELITEMVQDAEEILRNSIAKWIDGR